MDLVSKFQKKYIFFFLFVIGTIYTIRDYIFSLNSTQRLNWDLNLFSNFSDQIFWIPILLIFFRYFKSTSEIKTKRLKYWAYLISLIIILAFLHRYVTVVLGKYLEFIWGIISQQSYERIQKFYEAIIFGGTINDILFLVILLIILVSLQNYERFLAIQKKNLEITQEKNHAQMQTLKMQIQPHFLFNSLNTISSLMESSTEHAQNVMSKLASFLRESLDYQSQKLVTLRTEVSFTQKYLDLELERFKDRLTISIDITPETEGLKVPVFILQPFVENVFKHGVNKFSNVKEIEIVSKEAGNFLYLEISNNGGRKLDNLSFGTGILNIKKRLETLYEDNFSLDVISDDDGFRNIIKLPIEEA